MFSGAETLGTAIDGVHVAATGDAIAHARQQIDRLEAKLAVAEAEYCRDGGFEVDGFGSMAAFIRFRARMGLPDSRRVERRARKLAAWPDVADAWLEEDLSRAQVEAMTAMVPDRHVERFSVNATETVAVVASLTTGETVKALRRWVELADDAAQREAVEAGIEATTVVPDAELSASRIMDDRLEIRGSFDPDAAAYLEAALQAARRDDHDGELRSPQQRRADSLVEIARFYLAHHRSPPSAARPDRLVVVADVVALYRAALRGLGIHSADQLAAFFIAHPELGRLDMGLFLDALEGRADTARTLDGNPITDSLLSIISGNGILERLLTVDGRVIDQGRDLRVFTDSQRRAILARDQGCRSPGCDAPASRCQIHHLRPWETGGTTDLANGIAKCAHCHHEHHKRGWTERLAPDGTYVLTTPLGETRTSRPPGLSPPALPLHSTARPGPDAAPLDGTTIDRVGNAAGDATDDRLEWDADDWDDEIDVEVADQDLLTATAIVNGESWFVIAESPQELADTIVAMTTAA